MKASYMVEVTATDDTGESDTVMVTVMVTNMNEAPAFEAETADELSVAENTAAGMDIGAAVAATDADNDMLTYTLGGTDMASFAIDADSRPNHDHGSAGLRNERHLHRRRDGQGPVRPERHRQW